jgi:hypothetical protein
MKMVKMLAIWLVLGLFATTVVEANLMLSPRVKYLAPLRKVHHVQNSTNLHAKSAIPR